MVEKEDAETPGFEKLDAWKEARSLADLLSKLIKRPPLNKDYGLCDRIWKAALSVMFNIAEGYGSPTNKGFATLLGQAKRSAGEIRSHLYHIFDQRYISRDEFEEVHDQASVVNEEISRLISDLRRGGKAGR